MDLQSKTRFNKAPTINKRRTRFDLSHSILTTFNTGDFVPILCEPVYPGETFSLRTSSLTRLETSLHQTMDNAYVETAFFFVPSRVIYDDFDKFLGANDDPWSQTNEYHIPQIKLTSATNQAAVAPGSLLNHLMLPAGSYGYGSTADGSTFLSVDILPLRAVFQVYNDWFRDENYDSIIYFTKNGSDVNMPGYLFNGSYFYPAQANLKVNRFKDLFSTALPAPQKGQEVTLGLAGLAPIVASGDVTDFGDLVKLGSNLTPEQGQVLSRLASNDPTFPGGVLFGSKLSEGQSLDGLPISGSNLKANLSAASAVTINQLRLAIASQAISERDARGGTRLKEKIYATWGVQTNDLELDRSEFLGGKRFPVSMMEVLQTSETGTTVLGSDAGHSKTADSSESFIKSFTQYGWIVGFMYIRTARSYSQGIDRRFRNKSKYDLYDPMLDNIGELAVLKQEAYALDTHNVVKVNTANEVFGYQEAWYHLKERSNRFSGYFQPGINGTLDSWHYGDSYTDYPQISADWLKEDATRVDRTIAVSSNASFQWSANIFFELYATREMAKYSIPNTFGF